MDLQNRCCNHPNTGWWFKKTCNFVKVANPDPNMKVSQSWHENTGTIPMICFGNLIHDVNYETWHLLTCSPSIHTVVACFTVACFGILLAPGSSWKPQMELNLCRMFYCMKRFCLVCLEAYRCKFVLVLWISAVKSSLKSSVPEEAAQPFIAEFTNWIGCLNPSGHKMHLLHQSQTQEANSNCLQTVLYIHSMFPCTTKGIDKRRV